MLSIIDPVIRELSWLGQAVPEDVLREDVLRAQKHDLPVHAWTGEDREGSALVVVWVAGKRAGQLLSAFEITGR